ncbi:MAG: hypothetical protein CBE24_00635 [bacterium TMED264]|nr:MAG: hypothetical protein CBE24_00635 [bacterium TMED264]
MFCNEKGVKMSEKMSKKERKELLAKYTGYSLSGYCHLDDGTGDYARDIPEDSEESEEKDS